jgi:hypothetical protein
MNPNIPSIDQLQELGLPAPLPYTPHTWGWWALLGGLVLVAAILSARKYRRWRRDRYRREALQRLALLRQRSSDLAALRELPELLKRVALSMPSGNAQVAGLGAAAWQGFLQHHSPQALPADFSQQLAQLAYAPDATLQALPAQRRLALFDTCQQWVEGHHVAA